MSFYYEAPYWAVFQRYNHTDSVSDSRELLCRIGKIPYSPEMDWQKGPAHVAIIRFNLSITDEQFKTVFQEQNIQVNSISQNLLFIWVFRVDKVLPNTIIYS